MINYVIRTARPNEAAAIATLIMEAMNHDCCQWFAGPHHTLDDFHRLMTELVRRTDSQYSYLHTHMAVVDQEVVGVRVAAPYRKQGIASALIKAVVGKARSLGIPSVGLLVDSGNPKAEQLYTQIGFCHLDDHVWGGHPMRHLVIETNQA